MNPLTGDRVGQGSPDHFLTDQRVKTLGPIGSRQHLVAQPSSGSPLRGVLQRWRIAAAGASLSPLKGSIFLSDGQRFDSTACSRHRHWLRRRSKCPFGATSGRNGREVEGVALEMRCGETHRGFESHFLLQSAEGMFHWRGDREAEGARLEIVCGATHRGFESLPLRHEVARRSNCKPRQARKGATVVRETGCAASSFFDVAP